MIYFEEASIFLVGIWASGPLKLDISTPCFIPEDRCTSQRGFDLRIQSVVLYAWDTPPSRRNKCRRRETMMAPRSRCLPLARHAKTQFFSLWQLLPGWANHVRQGIPPQAVSVDLASGWLQGSLYLRASESIIPGKTNRSKRGLVPLQRDCYHLPSLLGLIKTSARPWAGGLPKYLLNLKEYRPSQIPMHYVFLTLIMHSPL